MAEGGDMTDFDQFAVQVGRTDLGSWHWSVIDRDGAVIARGRGQDQTEARCHALTRARTLSRTLRVAEPA
ncbi:hypothetical protein BZG35_14060 [Brevundimonas sp. LM2]|nr:hypothetical protein BZG35_14060 [Brevundimonas sp. LM2]